MKQIHKIIQVYEGIPSKEIHSCIDNIILSCQDNNIEHVLQSCFPSAIDRSKGLRNASDIFRFEYLIENSNDIWIDWDVKIGELGWFPFIDNGKPYFANEWGIPDTWVMAPMGNKKLIEDIYNKVIKSDYKLFSQAACRILNGMRDRIDLIPNGYFNHLSYHNKKETAK